MTATATDIETQDALHIATQVAKHGDALLKTWRRGSRYSHVQSVLASSAARVL